MDESIEGWELLTASPFAHLMGPIHVRPAPEAIFRTVVGPRCANTMGRMHGGYASALIDICMGQGVKRIVGDGRLLVTVSTHIDFLGSAALGDTLEIVAAADRVTRSVVFASCVISVRGEPVVRAAVVFSSRDKAAVAEV